MSYPATVDELAAALRTTVKADNQAAMQACIDAAVQEIEHYCDRTADDPIPTDDPLAGRVNLLRAVEWFKSTDAAFGVIGFDQTGALKAPRDGFARHGYALIPLKAQWGVA